MKESLTFIVYIKDILYDKVFALVSFLDQSNGVANNSREYEIPNCCTGSNLFQLVFLCCFLDPAF